MPRTRATVARPEKRSLQPREMRFEKGNKVSQTHGLASTATYRSWKAAKQRCTNPKNDRFYCYGAIGVVMCARWSESFENFLQDMGEKPSSDYVLSRVGDKGNYEPGNCRWITKRDNTLECDHKGERNSQAKLTEDKVREARRLHASGVSNSQIGKLLGVHRVTIADIIKGRTWKHVGT